MASPSIANPLGWRGYLSLLTGGEGEAVRSLLCALLVCATGATYADAPNDMNAAYRTSAHGWSTMHSCAPIRGDIWCWVMMQGESTFTRGFHVATVAYQCSYSGEEFIRLSFFTGGVQVDTRNPLLSVRWDVMGRRHTMETTKVEWGKTWDPVERRYGNAVHYTLGDMEHVIDRLRYHDTLWMDLPYVDKWERARFSLRNAIPAMRSALNACGLKESRIGWLGERP